MRRLQALIVLLGPLTAWHGAATCQADEPTKFSREQIDFFEKHVRPLLAAHCWSCHGAKKEESGLRLDSRQAVLEGGDRGPAVRLDDDKTSLLLAAVRHQGDLKMPPKAPLPKPAVEALRRWVRMGLPWPVESSATKPSATLPAPPTVAAARQTHWAFRPIRKPAVPRVQHPDWARTPIDRFVQTRLEQRGLSPSPAANRGTLIRRATFDLIGLPPTPAEVTAFLADSSPDAFSRLIERLLASPHYGERWARHWLDVARYADHKGYVFFEDRHLPWAYTYRDFVVDAFNDDLPYNRFVLLQLAADLVDLGGDKRPLRALGFLTVGGRFMNNTHDIADDRIDVITRGLMGLTVTCARCHDHKYDPISQADYYALYGILRSCREPLVPPLFARPPESDAYRKFAEELEKRQGTLREFVERKHAKVVRAARQRAADYLLAAHAARNKPRTDRFMLLTDRGDLNPSVIVRWRNYLEKMAEDHPVWALWHAYSNVPEAKFVKRAPMVAAELPEVKLNPLVRNAFAGQPPTSLKEVAERYGKLLNRIDTKWRELLRQAGSDGKSAPARLADPAEEQLRQVFYGDGAPGNVPKEFDWGFLSLLPDRPSQNEFKKLLGAVEKWATTGAAAPPRAMILQDAAEPFDPRVFLRGNPNRPGPQVPRRFVEVLSPSRHAFSQGSGRLELARAIIDPANPLTARVIANRVWLHHFGRALVSTPSDFGLRSDPPSHPDLLDYLAATLIERGWSLKDLHRRIMTSAVYQQASHDRAACLAADPENRLLWKMNRRRLEFEPLRDALLAISGSLDPQIGGPPRNMFGNALVPRRTLYGYINRLDLPTLLTTFDFPNPAASSPQRTRTTVPPQALFLMNHPVVAEVAGRVVARLKPEQAASQDDAIHEAYSLVFGRPPSQREIQWTRDFLGPQPTKDHWMRFVHGLMMTNEFAFLD